jgi:hypothetical protein
VNTSFVAARITTAALPALLALLVSNPGAAQDTDSSRLLPRARYFASPLADPGEPRMAIGLLITDVLASFGGEREPFFIPDERDSRSDWQAAASIGGTIPLLRLSQRADGGIIVSATTGVFARFRIEYPSRDEFATDWVIGMPIEMRWDRFSSRVRIVHHSSHMGDEFIILTGAERLEFGGETFDALGAWTFPGIARIYAGGGWIFRSQTRAIPFLVREGIDDRFFVQLGTDADWQPFDNQRLHIVAGADWQAAERTRWKSSLALAAGFTTHARAQSIGFIARFFTGRSSLGQFFNTPEQFTSLELRVEF